MQLRCGTGERARGKKRTRRTKELLIDHYETHISVFGTDVLSARLRRMAMGGGVRVPGALVAHAASSSQPRK